MTLDGRVLAKTSVTANKYAQYSVTNADPKPGWFIHDQYLYVINNKTLEKILLNSLFDDPEQISQINCNTSGETCADYMDTEFPVDSELVSPMYELTMKFLVNSLSLPPKDNENNAKDDQAG